MMYDVAIIGGGAAGLCAAVRLKQLSPELSVVIAEQLPRVGKKLITTGNGRCNITNRDLSAVHFHGEVPEFAIAALKRFDNNVADAFFRSIGVLFTYDETGRAYPYSLQAASVVDMLRFAADEKGVETRTETRIEGIRQDGKGFSLETADGTIKARCILVAAGLYSGGDKLGSDGKILRIMRDKLGYATVKTTPAIVQLKTDPQAVRSLKGIKVNGTVSLERDGKTVRTESGEVLFCDYGLSGPPVMQVSRAVERGGKFAVSIDIMPQYDFGELCRILHERIDFLGDRTAEEFFTGMLNKRVGQYILKNCGYSFSDSAAIMRRDVKKLAAAIKQMRFAVTGTTGFINSQVTAGGLDTRAFDENTMMSKKHGGLFAAGEILDIDGDCGGYNLQWAWSSAMTAAEGIICYLGDKI